MDQNTAGTATAASQFHGKKITLMGLGLLGRGLGDARFFAAGGADLTITDLKTEAELAPSIAQLANVRGPAGEPAHIIYHLGGHRLEDFENCDFIIRAPNAPLDSPFLAHARERGIPIEMDASLFMKMLNGSATVVGITGTRGKSTTTHLIYEMARAMFAGGHAAAVDHPAPNVYLGGNERDTATLQLLNKIGPSDIVILELDSWQLQGFAEDNLSPHIAVWTNFMPDHMNYYHGDMDRYFADKAAIARFQHVDDIFVAPREIRDRVEATFFGASKLPGTWTAPADIPADWEISSSLPGEHNRSNIACAIAVARALGVFDVVIKKILKSFAGLPGRLEFLGEKNGVAYYNDSNSTTPDAALAALRALAPQNRPIVLIAGGNDKELDFTPLVRELADLRVKKRLKALILFNGAASEKLKALLPANFPVTTMAGSMDDAFSAARSAVTAGDLILLSPGATSFGIFKNEYDRGDQFRKEFEKLA